MHGHNYYFPDWPRVLAVCFYMSWCGLKILKLIFSPKKALNMAHNSGAITLRILAMKSINISLPLLHNIMHAHYLPLCLNKADTEYQQNLLDGDCSVVATTVLDKLYVKQLYCYISLQIWVSNQPYLLTPYLAHYCPSLLHLIVAKKAREALDAAKKQN